MVKEGKAILTGIQAKLRVRVPVHALGFQSGFMVLLVPYYMWELETHKN